MVWLQNDVLEKRNDKLVERQERLVEEVDRMNDEKETVGELNLRYEVELEGYKSDLGKLEADLKARESKIDDLNVRVREFEKIVKQKEAQVQHICRIYGASFDKPSLLLVHLQSTMLRECTCSRLPRACRLCGAIVRSSCVN